MKPYTNMIWIEEYNRWRNYQDSNKPILSYEEWLELNKK